MSQKQDEFEKFMSSTLGELAGPTTQSASAPLVGIGRVLGNVVVVQDVSERALQLALANRRGATKQ